MIEILIYLILHTRYTNLGEWAVPNKIQYIKPELSGDCTCYVWHCVITIDPKKKGDIGLLEHEKVHAKQFGRWLWLDGVLKYLSSKYRLISELEAYREQVRYGRYNTKMQYKWIIDTIYTDYNLGLDREYIQEMADIFFADLIKINKGE